MQIHELISSDAGPIILWGMYPHRPDQLENTKTAVEKAAGAAGYTLIAFQADDWNSDFSPWQAETPDTVFSGNGEKTLEYIINELIPAARSKYGKDRAIYIMGYSLAGLFALWACARRTDIFAGAASCSGSLWYPGYADFIRAGCDMSGKRIYMSLGGKEANTANELMATVEEKTREISEILKKKNTVKFEMNPGGHFADSGKRLAKAVKWITEYKK